MEQTTIIDPKTHEAIKTLKKEIKQIAVDLRQLKLCRKTKNPVPNRDATLQRLGVQFVDDLPLIIQAKKEEVTGLHLLYGELRGKPHPVADPDRYAYVVASTKKRLLD